MAFDTVPWIIDGTTVDAEVIRRAIGTLIGPAGGIVAPGDMQVAQQTTPNMSVQIGVGQVWVPGTSSTSQGPYYSRNGAAVTQAINAANASNPRVDTIYVQVQDAVYAGSNRQLQPGYVAGTPTAGIVSPPTSAAQAAADGAGTVPASSLVLAYVLVPAAATSIVTADIANVATLASRATSAWAALTPASNASQEPRSAAYRLIGDTVNLRGGVITNGSFLLSSPLATLPAAIRPTTTAFAGGVTCATPVAANNGCGYLQVNTDGSTLLVNPGGGSATASSQYYFDSVSWSLGS